MDLTKEAIQEIKNSEVKPLEHIIIKDFGGKQTFMNVDTDGRATQLFIKDVKPTQPLSLSTLDSLVDYIKSDLDIDRTVFIHISDYDEIELKGQLLPDGGRELFAEVVARTPENTLINQWNGSEEFLIGLASQFINEYDRNDLIAFAGNVKEENARRTSDDGFSQKTVVKRGIASAQEELVPNPVTLAPYRTFIELDQPSSEFIFRMKDGPKFGLFEADGGAWKLEAIESIYFYLENKLELEIQSGKIIILA